MLLETTFRVQKLEISHLSEWPSGKDAGASLPTSESQLCHYQLPYHL